MLLEVIAAVAVVALGLTAFVSGLPVAAISVSDGAQRSTATFLAAARLDEVRAAGWRDGSVLERPGSAFPDEPSLPAPYAGYARQVRTADCGAATGCDVMAPGLREVTVTVAYRPLAVTGLSAEPKRISITALVARR